MLRILARVIIVDDRCGGGGRIIYIYVYYILYYCYAHYVRVYVLICIYADRTLERPRVHSRRRRVIILTCSVRTYYIRRNKNNIVFCSVKPSSHTHGNNNIHYIFVYILYDPPSWCCCRSSRSDVFRNSISPYFYIIYLFNTYATNVRGNIIIYTYIIYIL